MENTPTDLLTLIQQYGTLSDAVALSAVNLRFTALKVNPTHKSAGKHFPRGLMCWVYMDYEKWERGIPLNSTEPYDHINPRNGITFTCFVGYPNWVTGQFITYRDFGARISVNKVPPMPPVLAMPEFLGACTPYGIGPNMLNVLNYYTGSDYKYCPPSAYTVLRPVSLISVYTTPVGSQFDFSRYVSTTHVAQAKVLESSGLGISFDFAGEIDAEIRRHFRPGCPLHWNLPIINTYLLNRNRRVVSVLHMKCGCIVHLH
jgi:hypothetical protein